ncbi:MAG: hypothetical protein IPH23_04780 [Gammaproteobacteria bacterium]|nr:hypothetical protein [Gammaproteobacteria bacterium]
MHELILPCSRSDAAPSSLSPDVEERSISPTGIVVLAPQPGRIGSIHPVALPPARRAPPGRLKLAADFLTRKSCWIAFPPLPAAQRDLGQNCVVWPNSRGGATGDPIPNPLPGITEEIAIHASATL